MTLTHEIDGVLKRRPDLGTLAGEAEALRARVTQERCTSVPGASALTPPNCGCCRCFPRS